MSTIIYYFNIIKNKMENSFLNYANPLPYYYTLFPFQQYSCPKICNVLHIVNNLEDSTLPQPSLPQNAFFQTPNNLTPSQFPQSTPSSPDSQAEQPQRMKKTVKGGKKITKEEYKPYERQGKKKRNFLKDNRNVIPIKIRQMLSFLGRQSKSQEIIQKYVKRHGIFGEFSQKKFYAFLKMKKEKIGNYVTLPVLRQFLSVQYMKRELHPLPEQKLYLELVRVLLRYYLNHISALCSLTSNRIRPNQKYEHVRAQRELLECLKRSEQQ